MNCYGKYENSNYPAWDVLYKSHIKKLPVDVWQIAAAYNVAYRNLIRKKI